MSADQKEIVLKCATIAPEGFLWAEVIKKFSSEIQEKTSGAVRMEWYFSSIAGDEPEIAKKIKEGNLDCAWLTGNGLSYIIPPVRILELPFFLKNIKEVDFIRKKVEKLFQILASDYGMKFFGFSDIGFVYIFSKEPVRGLSDLRGKVMWVWDGDYLGEFIGKVVQEEFQVKPFRLPIQNVKANLDHIHVVWETPYVLIMLGWDTSFRYILSHPLKFSFAAPVVSQKSFSKIPTNYQKIFEDVLRKYIDVLTDINRESEVKIFEIILFYRKMGIKMIDFTPTEVKEAENIFREKVWVALKDKVYPSWLLAELLTMIHMFRTGEVR